MSENVNRHETATSEPASNQEGGSCSGASFCSPTLQVRYELANRVIRECDKLFQDGDDRFSVDAFGMLKDYAERECNVCVLFRTGGHDAQHFVAVIKYPVLEDKWGHFGLKPVLLIGRHPGKSEETVVDSAGDSDEQPVLIEVVHFTEERETILPAAVRLQRLDNIDGCGSNPGYFAVKALGVLHLKDWEACVASRNLSICLNELPRQVVECGPEVVDRIPDHQRERLWQLGPKADAEDFFTTVRIGFGFKTIRVSFAKLPRHDFDIIDVCFGPCDLSAGSVKSCDGGSHELVGERQK